jgi:hypothetical protein
MITNADDSTSEHVMLINEAMAKKFFPGESPVGKRLHELGMDRHRDNPITVIGVVGDVRSSDLARPPGPQHFVPYRQRPERGGFGVFVLRTGRVARLARRSRSVATPIDRHQRADRCGDR